MRFCNRCGDPVSGPRCKCGGTPKEAEGSGGGEGVTTLRRDVWSRKYLTKGLDQPVVGRPRSSSVSDPSTPKCPDCGLRLSPTVDGGMACRVCILKPSSKGICAACEKPVIPLAVPGQTATWVEYGTKVWHKDCFRCRICRVRLTNPMVDLTGQPCCEDCLMAQAGARTPMDEVTLETATSVPPSTYNNNSRQQSSALSDGSTLIKSTESLVEDKSPKNPTSAFSVTNNVTGATPVTVAAVTAVTAIPKEASLVPEKKKAISSPKASPKIGPSEFECSACKLPITDAGVRLPSGRLYHPHCFTCAECGKEFKQSAFVNYGGRAYHPDCTPKANVERCNDCGKLISGFYVKNNGASYHAECFKCSGCKTVIGPKTPFGEISDQPYCEACLKARITGDLYLPPPIDSPSMVNTTTTRRGSNDRGEQSSNTSFGVPDASLIQLDPSMAQDIGHEPQWHSTTKVAVTSPVLAAAADKEPKSTPVPKPPSPVLATAADKEFKSNPVLKSSPPPSSASTSPKIAPIPVNAAIGRAMGRSQLSPSPSSPPKNGRIGVISTAAELAFSEGVMGGARAISHARSRSAASPLPRPNTQSPTLSTTPVIAPTPASNGFTSGTSTPYASRPVSPRLRFEESLLSPNASNEIALSRSSSRSSNTSGWEPRVPPLYNGSTPTTNNGFVGRSVGTPTTTTFAPYSNQNGNSGGGVGTGSRFSQLGGTARCFKCQERLYASEEVPGPRATKWHRHCLVCLVCRKPLDSMALMRDDTDGPYCRMCYIKKGRRVTALM